MKDSKTTDPKNVHGQLREDEDPLGKARVSARQRLLAHSPFEQAWARKSLMEEFAESSIVLDGDHGFKVGNDEFRNLLKKSRTGNHFVTGGSSFSQGETPRRSVKACENFTDTRWFNIMIAVAVSSNAIQMGVETDHPEYATVYMLMENTFAAIFAFEMIAKLYFYKLGYFRSRWNILDFSLVWLSIIDLWLIQLIVGGSSGMKQLSGLRMLRILRVARMVRLLKVFKELWLIIKGIFDSFRTISWAALLLITMLYVFAILFVKTVGQGGDYYRAVEDPALSGQEIEYHPDFDAKLYYGNVLRSMYTSFETCLEPVNIRPVVERQPVMFPVFLFFIFISTCGVMNVIVGVIVETTMAASASTGKDLEFQKMRQKTETVERIRNACMKMDKDGDGHITLDELKESVRDPEITGSLGDVELPVAWTEQELYDLLDSGGQDKVTHMKVVKHLLRAVGSDPRGIIVDLKGGYRRLHRKIRSGLEKRHVRFNKVDEKLQSMRSVLMDGRFRLTRLGQIANQVAEHTANGKGEVLKKQADDPMLAQNFSETTPQAKRSGADPILENSGSTEPPDCPDNVPDDVPDDDEASVRTPSVSAHVLASGRGPRTVPLPELAEQEECQR
eukprot:gnl/MRDRNA2_/MRDRNA2_106790_c0_seq1.p1 gnl/MRDRNA2_/MRDRNA2_106790_c0~~gnl/MRDRNA2_/MRDRNA2_106790_c0_seq1.p1  ORF type:complete len:617 (+),score=105.03 gnl/MRDRNA2_/MRDRNA2_106790_c0_seq1:166-2016(+)